MRRRAAIPPCSKKYGLPLYTAAWIPINAIQQQNPIDPQKENEENAEKETLLQHPPSSRFLVFGGGGGEGRSGVPNALLLAHFDFSSASLSDEPVSKFGTDGELPYRMAVHPGGEGLVCSFPKTCKWFEWDVPKSMEAHKLGLKPSERLITQLEDVGLQLALTFNSEGSMLATGGEDGHLRVFKWPSMEVVLDQADAHVSVKDLDFSSEGKFLVSQGNSGPCRVWDLSSLIVVANLPRENGEIFGFSRFSRRNNQILYITAMKGGQGGIISWNTATWHRVASKQIVRDPISAFSVSSDGKFLAIGTIEGDIAIVNSITMRVQTRVRKAHLGLVTALIFSQDSRAVVSTSFDSSARVTIVEDKKRSGISIWIIFIIIIILAVIAYFVNESELLLYVCPHIKKGNLPKSTLGKRMPLMNLDLGYGFEALAALSNKRKMAFCIT